jgi:hypothetical protein
VNSRKVAQEGTIDENAVIVAMKFWKPQLALASDGKFQRLLSFAPQV